MMVRIICAAVLVGNEGITRAKYEYGIVLCSTTYASTP